MINLNKLLYDTSNLSPTKVQAVLNKVFDETIIEARNEPLFNLQIRCIKNDSTRLIIRYGWSANKNRWFFEPIGANK